jgi:hypothetical protein
MTAKGKGTTGLRREVWLNEEGKLCYNMYLGVNGEEPKHHLEACLEKVAE